MKKTETGRRLAVDLLFDLLGTSVYSVAVQCFSAPNNIAPGGVSGISVLINYLTGLPISILSFCLNVPLLLMAWYFLGHRFTLRTLKTVVVMTVMLELAEFLPVYQGNPILAALFGGVLEGFGLAVVFMRGSTSGGSDIASRLLQLKFPYMPVGRLLLVVDGLVLVAAAVVYRSIENALFGLIVIYTSTHVIDGVLYGLDVGKVMLIISKSHGKIADGVNRELGRGCTILSATGSYTGEDRPVLLCAVRRQEYVTLKRLVRSVDPEAFLLVMEANEVIGEGFKSIEKDG